MIRTLSLDLSWLFIFVLTSWAIGNKILVRLLKIEFPDSLCQNLISTGAGLAFFSFLTFTLGMAGLLYPWVFVVLLLLLLLSSHNEVKGLFDDIINLRFPLPSNKFEMILFVFLGIALLSNLIFNYAPPTQPRETMYDLSLPKMYLEAHRIFELKDKQVYYYPHQIQMLYILGMALRGALLAKLIHFLFGILSLGLIYSLAHRYYGATCARMCAVVFYLMPLTSSLSGTANIDLGTLFYGLLAFTFLTTWVHSESQRFLYAGAFFAGVVLGTKLIGLSTALAFIFFSAYWTLFYRKEPLRKGLTRIFWVGSFVFLGVSPWIFRNIYFTGNPFAPVSIPLLGIMGHPDANLELLLAAQTKATMVFSDYLKGFRNIFFGTFIYGGGPLLFAALPFAFMKQETRKNSLLLFSLAFLNFVILFCLLPIHHKFYETRYYIVSYGIFALLSGVGIETLLSLTKKKIFVQGWLVLSLLFPCLLFSLLFSSKRLPLFFGFQSQESYLQEKLKFFNVWNFANQNIPSQSKVLTLGSSNPDQFYWKSILIAPSFDLLQERDPQKIINYLRKEEIKYIFFYDAAYKILPNTSDLFPKWSSAEILRWNWQEFKNKNLREIYRGDDGTLYQVNLQ